MSFKKLNIDSLSRFQNSGVCDVCSKQVSPGEAYIIDNPTFYRSPGYRRYCKKLHKNAAGLMNGAYFDGLLAQDCSEGSAVCENCIHMFAAKPRRKVNVKKIVIPSAAALLVLGASILGFILLRNSVAYSKAEALYNSEDYTAAYESFLALGDYRDSQERAESIFSGDEFDLLTKIKYSKPGDTLDLYKPNGKGIKWHVVAKEGSKVLLCEAMGTAYTVNYYEKSEIESQEYVYWFGTYDDIADYLRDDIGDYLIGDGAFIPDLEDYDMYIKDNDTFVPDKYAWLIKDSFSYLEDGHAYYVVQYVGTDRKLYGMNTSQKDYKENYIVQRYFMWLDTEKSD